MVVVFAVLALLPAPSPHPRISRHAAIAAAVRSREIRADLARYGPYDRVRVTGVDRTLDRVSFFDGAQLVLDVAVDERGTVRSAIPHPRGVPPRGSTLASRPLALALLLAVFLFATLALPLRQLRNLDVAALGLLVVPQVLLTDRFAEASVLAAYPPLAYLAVRCAVRGLRGPLPAAAETRALWRAVLASRDAAERRRLLLILTSAAGVAVTVLTVTSTGVSDVGFASVAGATLLTHGTLPYGHMPPDLVHGDTYPLLSYAAHIPVALISPVHDGFDDLDGALWVAAAATLATAAALAYTARRRLGASPWAAALAWLTFPPVVAAASSGANDLLVAACVAGALTCATRAARPLAILAVGAWVKIAPVVLIPIWLARMRSRGLRRGTVAVLAVSALVVVWTLADGGSGSLRATVHALAFQLHRGSLASLWGIYGLDALQRLAQAVVLVFVAVAVRRARRAGTGGLGLRELAALSGAALIGLQLTANSWAFEYVVWIFPPVYVALIGMGRVPAAPIGHHGDHDR